MVAKPAILPKVKITSFSDSQTARDYRELFSAKGHWLSLVAGVALFAVALGVQAFANRYVGHVVSIAVPDIILDHVPTLDIDGLIIQSVLFVSVVSAALVVLKPRYMAFGLKTLSLFIIIRAIMISLTHLGANPHQLAFNPNDVGYGLYNVLYNTNNDFFFSAHTGAPFLAALVFWRERGIRYFYLITSALFGASMLVAHIHYSIDVAAAPFMTYAIFSMSRELFTRDYALLQ